MNEAQALGLFLPLIEDSAVAPCGAGGKNRLNKVNSYPSCIIGMDPSC
jgi:hypothetical protein